MTNDAYLPSDTFSSKCGSCGRDRRELAGGLRSRSKVDKKAAVKLILDCPICASALYKVFREETGFCETCRIDLELHPRCYLCGILLGPGHESKGLQGAPGNLWCGSCHKQRSLAAL